MAHLFSRPVRKYIYMLTIAAIPLLIYFDWLPEEAAPVILPVILALLNLSPEEVKQPERPDTVILSENGSDE